MTSSRTTTGTATRPATCSCRSIAGGHPVGQPGDRPASTATAATSSASSCPRTRLRDAVEVAERVRAAIREVPGSGRRACGHALLGGRGHVPRGWRRPRRRCCWPPTAPSTPPSAPGETGSATAADGLALAGEFVPPSMPVDEPRLRAPAAQLRPPAIASASAAGTATGRRGARTHLDGLVERHAERARGRALVHGEADAPVRIDRQERRARSARRRRSGPRACRPRGGPLPAPMRTTSRSPSCRPGSAAARSSASAESFTLPKVSR